MTLLPRTLADHIFRAFADPVRLRILRALQPGELCVCDLVEILRLPQPTISRHLAHLRRAQLLDVRSEGAWKHYALAAATHPLQTLLLTSLEHCAALIPQSAGDDGRARTVRANGGRCATTASTTPQSQSGALRTTRDRGLLTTGVSRVALVLVLCLALPRFVSAQDAPDFQALAEALQRERAEVARLRAELDLRSNALATLARELAALLPARGQSSVTEDTAGPVSASALAAPPPPAAVTVASTPSPEAPAAPPRVEFYGDSRVRYETLQQHYDGCVGCPNRQRGRLRVRFGAEGRLAPDFRAVIGLGLGELNDPNTVYAKLGGDFRRKVTTWDRAFIEYHPQRAKWLNLTAGKFPYTWLRSSMTFDVDFYPEGLSQRVAFDVRNGGILKQVSAQAFELIFAEQPIDRHMTIAGGQLTARLQPTARVTTTVAATSVSIHRPERLLRALLDGSDAGVRNTNAVVQRDGQSFYASGFKYANVIVENAIRTRWEALPVTVGLEYQHNLQAASGRDTAWSVRFDGGRAQKRGDWDFGFHLFKVEQDAILAGLGESDWRTPSNVLQQRWALNRMLHANVQLSFTLYRGRTLNADLPGAILAPGFAPGRRDPWVNRAYLDVTYRY